MTCSISIERIPTAMLKYDRDFFVAISIKDELGSIVLYLLNILRAGVNPEEYLNNQQFSQNLLL